MSSITEQFSAVTKSQLEAQVNIFNSYAHTAVASAEKLIALNLNATRATVEKSSATARKLLEAKDSRELLNVQRDTPTNLDALLAYSRELFAIASNAQAELIKSTRHLAQHSSDGLREQAQPLATAATQLAQAAPAASKATITATPEAATQAAADTAPAAAAPKTADTATSPAAADVPAKAVPQPAAPAKAVLAPVVDPDSAPVAAQAVAAPASIPAAVSAAVQAAVQAADAPVGAATVATPAKPKPVAATVAPTPPEAIKPDVQPIALAADSKPAKLKPVPAKGKPAEAPGGKQRK